MTYNSEWFPANYQYFTVSVASVRRILENTINQQGYRPDSLDILLSYPAKMSIPPALQQLCAVFGLTQFERNVLLLCAGMVYDAKFGSLCSKALGDDEYRYPSVLLAMKVLPEADWNAFTPQAPLRRWQLIQIGEGLTFSLNPLRIDERIFHYLLGLKSIDERLRFIISPIEKYSHSLVPSHEEITQQVTAIWAQGKEGTNLPIVQLYGDDITQMQTIASYCCETLGLQLFKLSTVALPNDIAELSNLLLLWEREAKLTNSVLLLDTEDGLEATKQNLITYIIENITSLLIITSRSRLHQLKTSSFISFEVGRPTRDEQATLWHNALGELVPNINEYVELLVSQFNLNVPTINAVCTEVRALLAYEQTQITTKLIWDVCRSQTRLRLDDLAQPMRVSAAWDDLVLTDVQRQTLLSVAAHVRQRIQVYEKWGFARKGERGNGISALFSGTSGTGKTTSAEVLASELGLDLYRVDISATVSKYIGETEKNLGRIFDAASNGTAILLFDEADALFGKRSDVKDARDRYANMEVSYLLQRMEEYQGLSILTTNLKDSIDTAFLRRIRFAVQFDFPDSQQREEIWRRIFPKNTPTEGLDYTLLARLNIAGGNIRNIALNAAFIAADSGEPVMMKHILQAARAEYMKLERSLTSNEIKGWV